MLMRRLGIFRRWVDAAECRLKVFKVGVASPVYWGKGCGRKRDDYVHLEGSKFVENNKTTLEYCCAKTEYYTYNNMVGSLANIMNISRDMSPFLKLCSAITTATDTLQGTSDQIVTVTVLQLMST